MEQSQHWFKISGKRIHVKDLLFHQDSFDKNSTEYAVVDFALKWIEGANEFQQYSSGSTGKPKRILLKREQMIASAEATVDTLGLNKGDTSLLSLNPGYIGGKMMIVRALVHNLNLIVGEVKGNPLIKDLDGHGIDFYSFVPYQLSKTLLESPKKIADLDRAKAIILGGAPVTNYLELQIRQMLTAPVYSTYGMTETVSHVALKRLNGAVQEPFKALKNIKFSQDETNCLVIHAPQITGLQSLATNDVVELYSDKAFEWLGRKDFVINSGGIKIHPEQVEKVIEPIMTEEKNVTGYFIFERPDEQLGAKVCLAVQGKTDTTKLLHNLKRVLPAYHVPKEIGVIPQFILTESGKVNRIATIKKAASKLD